MRHSTDEKFEIGWRDINELIMKPRPGDEAGSVRKGTRVRKVQGQPDKPLKVGENFCHPRGSVHGVGTVPGSDGGTAISVWIVDTGQSLATPVS